MEKLFSLLDSSINKNYIFHFKEIDSTNEKAKQLAKTSYPHGTVVIADFQSAGKGTKGRSFYSPINNGIYLSIVLHLVNLNIKDISFITPYCGLVVCEVIEKLTNKLPKIKWVNDVYINDKKVCGILTESLFSDGKLKWAVVGIGINLTAENFPDELKPIASGVFDRKIEVPKEFFISEILNKILSSNDFLRKSYKEYEKRLLFKDEIINVIKPNEEFSAKILGINSSFELIVEKNDKSVENLISAEIKKTIRK